MSNPTSYLAQIDAEPSESKLKLVRSLMRTDPLGLFKELRENRPIFALPECTLVALYDDVTEMLNMPKIFTVALYKPKMAEGYLMCHDEDALHYREKSLMQSLLNRDDLPRVRQLVEDSAQAILKKAGNKIDAVPEYCRTIPALIVQKYFGLVGINIRHLMEWSYWAQVDTFYNQPFDIVSPEDRKRIIDSHTESGKKLEEYITALMLGQSVSLKLHLPWRILSRIKDGILKLLGRPVMANDRIVERMLRTGFPPEMNFDIKRVGINAGGLLIGTIETTAQASVQALQYILDNPEVLQQAQKAAVLADKRAFDGIVWEALRFVPISPYMFRQTAWDYTLAKGTARETLIKANTNVLALTQSAMFDIKAFENPDAFISNRNWYHYFTFGYGSHECIGKYIGMVMIPEIVRQMLLMPNLKAQGNMEYDGHMPKSYALAWG